uniref:Uncharacterized protein n=1 Tax=Xiphophorus maculatus TaxID=8083 RepID=A0A3B5Q5S9_XIPMA
MKTELSSVCLFFLQCADLFFHHFLVSRQSGRFHSYLCKAHQIIVTQLLAPSTHPNRLLYRGCTSCCGGLCCRTDWYSSQNCW